MIGSSVVPGLPNRCVTPSSFSRARNAERPVILFFIVPPARRFVGRAGWRADDQTWRAVAMERGLWLLFVSRTRCSAQRCNAEPGPTMLHAGPRLSSAELRTALRPRHGERR